MSREDNTTQIKHSRLEDVHTDLGAEAARLLFAHVDPSTPAEGHADRAAAPAALGRRELASQ